MEPNIALMLTTSILFISITGDYFFKKTGWPESLFLILLGVILGPITGLIQIQYILPILPLFSTLTLIMILFRGGMGLDFLALFSGGTRGFVQAILYFLIGMISTTLLVHYVFSWSWLEALLLGSIISQTGSVVILPLTRGVNIHQTSIIILSLEAVLTSVFNIVFFLVLLEANIGQSPQLSTIFTTIISKLLLGVVIGGTMGVIWLRLLLYLKDGYSYVATIGYLFLCFVASEVIGGSGALSVLTFSMVLINDEPILKTIAKGDDYSNIGELKRYLINFQGEMSFLLRTFFFVLLGVMLDLNPQGILTGIIYAIPIIMTLIAVRYMVVRVSTWRSGLEDDRHMIIGFCALGITPALLCFMAVQYNLTHSIIYINIITTLIIITNIITSLIAFINKRKNMENKKGFFNGFKKDAPRKEENDAGIK